MLLCLDVGNTHILGGVFKYIHSNDSNQLKQNHLIFRFRYATHLIGTADQFGIFLLNIMMANKIEVSDIKATAIASVVPSYDFTIKHMTKLYFKATYFSLQAGIKTGLNIRYKNPNEVGADRIANAVGAIEAFPNKPLIIVDMGTATTLCAISKTRDYLGGIILPGIRLGMESLKTNTAKLMEVDIEACQYYIGRTTKESIQSGLYFGQLGALREMITGVSKEKFGDEKPLVIGTGGFTQLYKNEKLFDVILPDLVLHGLAKAYAINHDTL